MNWKGDVEPPLSKHLEMITEEDYPCIASIAIKDEVIDRRDPKALLAAANIQQPSIDFKDRGDLMTALTIDEKTSSATKPLSITEEPDFGRIPFEPDEVGAVLSSVSNTLDPVSFADALVNECAKSEVKMSIGATNILPDDEVDDL